MILELIAVLLYGAAPDFDWPPHSRDRFVEPVKKVGRLNDEFIVDNYTAVTLDGETSSFAALPEGATITEVVVEGKRVTKVAFESKGK
jgi:hypothetical protein